MSQSLYDRLPYEFKPIARSFDFKGRAGRREFWSFTVFWPLLFIIGGGIIGGVSSALKMPTLHSFVWWIGRGLAFALIIPFLSVAARRFHDMNRSGWWTLVILIPFGIGIIALLVALMFKGTSGTNRFGPQTDAQ